MTTGFIYIANTLNKNYVQNAFCNVPTQFGKRIYFGPCKIPMRPKIKIGDYIFGISPSKVGKRKIVFTTQVEERITFKEAYERFPYLRGPNGPIHVKPVNKSGKFPNCCYEHIPGAIHQDTWKRDISSKKLDAFFIGNIHGDFVGRWLGKYGPDVNDEIFNFIKRKCSVYGKSGKLSDYNNDATVSNPIAFGGLYTGLHLETREPYVLIELCKSKMLKFTRNLDEIITPNRDDKRTKSCRTC